MAKLQRERTLVDLFNDLFDEVRRLKMRQNRVGAWTLVEDRATGNLVAMRYNGQGIEATVVILAERGPNGVATPAEETP
jgi:hypothetical protein